MVELELVGEKMARLLADNGFSTIAAISAASTDELCEVPGIGPKRAELLIEAARTHEKSTGSESNEG